MNAKEIDYDNGIFVLPVTIEFCIIGFDFAVANFYFIVF